MGKVIRFPSSNHLTQASETFFATASDAMFFAGGWHPEEELRKAGANYQANHRFIDPLATLTVIDEEKRFVTGQNQNSSHETAQMIMKVLSEGRTKPMSSHAPSSP